MPPPLVEPDTTVRALDPLTGSEIRYHVGEGNWASPLRSGRPWVPDLANPGAWEALSPDEVIDIVVLGDGYTGHKVFENQLEDFVADFFELEVYRQFAGAFRIRALYTESAGPCDADARDTFYRVVATDDGVVRDPEWWNEAGAANAAFRSAVQASLDRFAPNTARYPSSLDVGDDPVIHNPLAGLYRNLVVVMLVRTDGSQNVEGMTRIVESLGLNIGFGSHAIHEFGHAFAYLEDEYISKRGSEADRGNPWPRSVFTLSNLCFDPSWAAALWGHLSPWGLERRSASGAARAPLVGWLWRGGEDDRGVWHSEYHCLMNGRNHENYAYSTTEGDETLDTDLRFRTPVMFCLWCQEIATIRILEKTGRLDRADDPADMTARGMTWYWRWVTELRPHYWRFFDLPHQIREREAIYAHPEDYPDPDAFDELQVDGGSHRRLDFSDLVAPFEATARSAGTPPAWSEVEELLVLTA